MNKNPIKQVALILLFFLVFGINAEDISITYDPTYFNPLAVSFKWDVKFNKKLDADHQSWFNMNYTMFKYNILFFIKKI